jgi:hypothetical protein
MKSTSCSGGKIQNHPCYLVPKSGPGMLEAFQKISHNPMPPELQFSARFLF